MSVDVREIHNATDEVFVSQTLAHDWVARPKSSKGVGTSGNLAFIVRLTLPDGRGSFSRWIRKNSPVT